MSVVRTRVTLRVLTVILFLPAAGCDTALSPAGPEARPRFTNPSVVADVADANAVLTVQLRTVPGFAVLAWGNLQLREFTPVDPCVPPNPIVPAGQTLVSVCGRIFNEGGAVYQGGGLYTVPEGFDESPLLIASFNSPAQPVDPCRRYDLSGFILLPDATASAVFTSPTRYQVLFGSEESPTLIGGRLDGLAWGPVGARAESDVFFAQTVCNIVVQP